MFRQATQRRDSQFLTVLILCHISVTLSSYFYQFGYLFLDAEMRWPAYEETMIDIPLQEITETHLQSLIEQQVGESRTLELKAEIGSDNKATVEFVRDVTALANTQGGHLIIGICENNGVASALRGIQTASIDDEIQRLENIIRSRTEPRLTSHRIRSIRLSTGNYVIIVHVKPSLIAPHAVRDSERRSYFARNSNGKHEMEVNELRDNFLGNEQLIPRLRALHREATEAAEGVNMPFRVQRFPYVTVSVIPLNYFQEKRFLQFQPESAVVGPNAGYESFSCLEGLIMYGVVNPAGDPTPENAVRGFSRNHWQGRVDASWIIGRNMASNIDPYRFAREVIDLVNSATSKLLSFGVTGPWVVFCSVENILKSTILDNIWHGELVQSWRNSADLTEIIMEEFRPEALDPLFKQFWLLFGRNRPETNLA